jgi:hypothetical protein
MSDSAGDFAGVIAVITIFGLPVTYAIVNRVLAHQERLEMLRRGMTPPPDPRAAKRWGTWYGPGSYGAPPAGFDPYYAAYAQGQRSLRGGIVVAMVGLALLVGLSFIDPGRRLGPWLLGGLIPLFVGIAQIIIGLMSGGRFGAPPYVGPGMPPPGMQQPGPQAGQGPFAQPDVTPPGYGGWRPGATTELEKPPSPPDRR